MEIHFCGFCRQHFLQCKQGLLNKHYDKLIQCDLRLNLVTRQPQMGLDSPYFEAQGSVLKDPVESEAQEVGQLEMAKRSPIPSFKDVESPSTAQSCSFTSEEQNSAGLMSEHLSSQAPSPSSGTTLSLRFDMNLFFIFIMNL